VFVLVVGLFISLMIGHLYVARLPWTADILSLSDISVVEAQAMSSPWNRTFGGVESDGGYSVVEVSTGGFACAGYTMSSGAGLQDVWLVRTGVDGTPQWSQTYGGVDSDWGRSICEVGSGEFILVGETSSFGVGSTDVYLLRIGSDGTLLWNQTHGGVFEEGANSIIVLSGGDYLIVGLTGSYGMGNQDVWLVRTDANGNHLWNQTYGGTFGDNGVAVIEVSSGGFALAGYTNSFGAGGADAWLIRTDVNGNLLWSRTYGGLDYDYGISVIEVIGDNDMWLIRTNAYGNHL
jgi:hypothetical protein